jgi:hypothetical protein
MAQECDTLKPMLTIISINVSELCCKLKSQGQELSCCSGFGLQFRSSSIWLDPSDAESFQRNPRTDVVVSIVGLHSGFQLHRSCSASVAYAAASSIPEMWQQTPPYFSKQIYQHPEIHPMHPRLDSQHHIKALMRLT